MNKEQRDMMIFQLYCQTGMSMQLLQGSTDEQIERLYSDYVIRGEEG